MNDVHKIKWLHLGNQEIYKECFTKISNHSYMNKPYGGLWLCPYTPKDKYVSAWHDFVHNASMGCIEDKGVIVTLKSTANIYIIDTYEDLKNISTIVKENDFTMNLVHMKKLYELMGREIEDKLLVNFEELTKKYDGIYLTEHGEFATRSSFNPTNLYGWDCECMVLFNYDCIKTQTPFSKEV